MSPFLLIADSNDAVLKLHTRFLADQGYRVESASDGIACLAHLRRGPDVLILDSGLLWGGADGVLAQIRESTDVPSVPVILTGTSDLRHADFASLPVVARLLKPFRLSALVEAVESAQLRLKVACQLN